MMRSTYLGTTTLNDREEQLLRSAFRVMVERGGHRLSLQDIADDAGVSKGLLLYHFGSKEQLLLMTMRWAVQRIEDSVLDALATARDADEALCRLVDALFVSAEANRAFQLFYLDLVEHSVRVRDFRSLPEQMRDSIQEVFARLIRQGVDEGTFHVQDPDRAAAAMRAQIEGTFLLWMQTSDWASTHADAKQRCHEALRQLLGSG